LTDNIRDAGARLQRTIFEQIGRVRHDRRRACGSATAA
jgi:hypothetical protein